MVSFATNQPDTSDALLPHSETYSQWRITEASQHIKFQKHRNTKSNAMASQKHHLRKTSSQFQWANQFRNELKKREKQIMNPVGKIELETLFCDIRSVSNIGRNNFAIQNQEKQIPGKSISFSNHDNRFARNITNPSHRSKIVTTRIERAPTSHLLRNQNQTQI